jgi:hypothetical protein
MGQLISLHVTEAVVENFSFDRRPRTLSECVVNRKLETRRHLEYKKRSYTGICEQVAELLFGQQQRLTENEENAEFLREEQQQRRDRIQPKKRRKQKEVVMFTDIATGLRSRLLPKMSIWYVQCFAVCYYLNVLSCALIVLLFSN